MTINATLLGQMIAFTLFALFCFKFVWPPMITVLRQRQEQIASGLRNAELAEQKINEANTQSANIVDSAKKQAQTILDSAQKRANQIVDEAKDQAVTEAERVKTQAQADIAKEKSSAREELRKEIAKISVLGAEKILKSSVDAQKSEAMVGELLAEIK